MDNKTNKEHDAEYTLDMLLNDIQESRSEQALAVKVNEETKRENRYKMKVLQMLMGLAKSYGADEYKDKEKLGIAILNLIETDGVLSGFEFYVSQNPQFDYTWNYMRKCVDQYKGFLVQAILFLNAIVEDINLLAKKRCEVKDVHVVIDDFFDVTLANNPPYAKACALWEKFHRMAAVKKNYTVTVKVKESILYSGVRKKALDAEKIFDNSMKLLEANKQLQDEARSEIAG